MKNAIKKMGTMALALVLFTLASCSKYEDGPGISLRSKKTRLVGDWIATKYVDEDGMDLLNVSGTQTFYCLSGESFPFNYSSSSTFHLSFNKDGSASSQSEYNYNSIDYSASYDVCQPIYLSGTDNDESNFSWEFDNNKEEIKLTYSDGSTENWKILELRESQIKFRFDDGQTAYEMTLIKE